MSTPRKPKKSVPSRSLPDRSEIRPLGGTLSLIRGGIAGRRLPLSVEREKKREFLEEPRRRFSEKIEAILRKECAPDRTKE